MATFFHGGHFSNFQPSNPHPMPHSHNNHHGRSRRAPRMSGAQNAHRQYRGPKQIKESPIAESPSILAYRARFEAGRSFDLEDDLEFCPNLMTNDEVNKRSALANNKASFLNTADPKKRHSIYSSSSDRSSLSSGSPDSSPTQLQIQPHSAPPLNVTTPIPQTFVSPPTFVSNMVNMNNNNLQIHQPSPYRVRQGIPIVDPNNRSRVASPPSSVSPGVMQASAAGRHY